MRVLILGGGGTLGAFSAGALAYMEESRSFTPDVVICSSAGGINYLRSTVGGAKEAVRFWESMSGWPMIREALTDNPFNGGLLDEKHFYARVEERVDFEKLFASRERVGFLVVDLAQGTVDVLGNRTELDAEALRRVSRAAYSLPPLLPPVAHKDSLFADGGLLHNAPLEAALELGAKEIVYLCNVGVVPAQWKSSAWTAPALFRYADVFVRRASNVGFAGAKITEGRFHGAHFLSIAAPADGGLLGMVNAMLPTRSRIGRLVDRGMRTAREAFSGYGEVRTTPTDAAALAMGASSQTPPETEQSVAL